MSRVRAPPYGKQLARDLGAYLATHNVPVIGGLSKRIEGYAHTAAIHAGGTTLAFLGHGLDSCYPKEHQELMEAITQHGAVLSQFPVECTGLPANFPKRNNLMSSWAQSVVVVETTKRSAALITARQAKNLGRFRCREASLAEKARVPTSSSPMGQGYVDPAQLLDGHPKPSQFSPAISRVRAPKPKKKRQETSTPKCDSPLNLRSWRPLVAPRRVLNS